MIDLERRVLVASPPVGEALWSGIGPVGLLRYRAVGVPAFAVVVRVVSPFPEPGEAFLPGVPYPAWGEPVGGGHEALRAREMVPFKGSCDVGFRGTLGVVGAGGEEGSRESGSPESGSREGGSGRAAAVTLDVRVGDTARGFAMELSGATVDLGRVRAKVLGGGGDEVMLGPGETELFEDGQHFHLEEDQERFRSAGAALRFPYPEVGSRVRVEAPFFSLDAALGFELFVRVDYLDGSVSLPEVRCDAVLFDLDLRQAEWVFRAVAVDPAEGREIERVVVAAFPPGQDEDRARVDAWLPHARFAWAAGPREVKEQVHPRELGDDELTMARYSTWDTGHFASTLPIEEVAQIQVEMLRGRARGAVLEAHGLSEYQWCVEERAAMERLAEAGLAGIEDGAAGDPGDGLDTGSGGPGPKSGAVGAASAGADGAADEDARDAVTRYREARARALAETPFEGKRWSVAEYADLRAALSTRNPVKVLEKAGLGPAELVGLDFEMAARMEAHPAERAEYEACFERALAREEAAAEGADDFSPAEDEDDEGDDDEEDDDE